MSPVAPEPRLSQAASRVNEIDASGATTHAHSKHVENRWAVVSIYMAFT